MLAANLPREASPLENALKEGRRFLSQLQSNGADASSAESASNIANLLRHAQDQFRGVMWSMKSNEKANLLFRPLLLNQDGDGLRTLLELSNLKLKLGNLSQDSNALIHFAAHCLTVAVEFLVWSAPNEGQEATVSMLVRLQVVERLCEFVKNEGCLPNPDSRYEMLISLKVFVRVRVHEARLRVFEAALDVLRREMWLPPSSTRQSLNRPAKDLVLNFCDSFRGDANFFAPLQSCVAAVESSLSTRPRPLTFNNVIQSSCFDVLCGIADLETSSSSSSTSSAAATATHSLMVDLSWLYSSEVGSFFAEAMELLTPPPPIWDGDALDLNRMLVGSRAKALEALFRLLVRSDVTEVQARALTPPLLLDSLARDRDAAWQTAPMRTYHNLVLLLVEGPLGLASSNSASSRSRDATVIEALRKFVANEVSREDSFSAWLVDAQAAPLAVLDTAEAICKVLRGVSNCDAPPDALQGCFGPLRTLVRSLAVALVCGLQSEGQRRVHSNRRGAPIWQAFLSLFSIAFLRSKSIIPAKDLASEMDMDLFEVELQRTRDALQGLVAMFGECRLERLQHGANFYWVDAHEWIGDVAKFTVEEASFGAGEWDLCLEAFYGSALHENGSSAAARFVHADGNTALGHRIRSFLTTLPSVLKPGEKKKSFVRRLSSLRGVVSRCDCGCDAVGAEEAEDGDINASDLWDVAVRCELGDALHPTKRLLCVPLFRSFDMSSAPRIIVLNAASGRVARTLIQTPPRFYDSDSEPTTAAASPSLDAKSAGSSPPSTIVTSVAWSPSSAGDFVAAVSPQGELLGWNLISAPDLNPEAFKFELGVGRVAVEARFSTNGEHLVVLTRNLQRAKAEATANEALEQLEVWTWNPAPARFAVGSVPGVPPLPPLQEVLGAANIWVQFQPPNPPLPPLPLLPPVMPGGPVQGPGPAPLLPLHPLSPSNALSNALEPGRPTELVALGPKFTTCADDPRKLVGCTSRCELVLWSLTADGSLKSEARIFEYKIKSATNLLISQDGCCIALVCWGEVQLFAGKDLARLRRFTPPQAGLYPRHREQLPKSARPPPSVVFRDATTLAILWEDGTLVVVRDDVAESSRNGKRWAVAQQSLGASLRLPSAQLGTELGRILTNRGEENADDSAGVDSAYADVALNVAWGMRWAENDVKPRCVVACSVAVEKERSTVLSLWE